MKEYKKAKLNLQMSVQLLFIKIMSSKLFIYPRPRWVRGSLKNPGQDDYPFWTIHRHRLLPGCPLSCSIF